jgi:lipid A 3-O-deacylase
MSYRRWLAALLVVLAVGTVRARASDLPPAGPVYAPVAAPAMVPSLYDPTRWEFRFGGFMHGVGSVEKNTWDVNGELVLPQFFSLGGFWSVLVPRLHAGVNANVNGRTSAVYGGFLWTLPIFERFFAEIFADLAAHNGSLTGDATHAELGCNPLFHVGGSVGYRFDQHWSVMGTFDHLSNGSGIGLTNCGRNKGNNNYGLRVGYAF